jgi:hypothetical protein
MQIQTIIQVDPSLPLSFGYPTCVVNTKLTCHRKAPNEWGSVAKKEVQADIVLPLSSVIPKHWCMHLKAPVPRDVHPRQHVHAKRLDRVAQVTDLLDELLEGDHRVDVSGLLVKGRRQTNHLMQWSNHWDCIVLLPWDLTMSNPMAIKTTKMLTRLL